MKPGEIDRTTEHEKSGELFDRCGTPRGLATELIELHRLVVDQQLLPPGSDLAVRFSLLLGMAWGTLVRLDDQAKARAAEP